MDGIIEKLYSSSHHVVGKLAWASKKLKRPSEDDALLARLDEYLFLLSEIDMRPDINDKARVSHALRVICATDKDHHFQERHVQHAAKLLCKFESMNWGAPSISTTTEVVLSPQQGLGPIRSHARSITKQHKRGQVAGHRIHHPPKDHHIWGVGGIMHGLAVKRQHDGRKINVLDPRCRHEQRDCRIYGANGLTVGQWFPLQLSARFHGAHGHIQGGIHGDRVSGAYSILVSSGYEFLDQDQGNTLHYSGTGSHDNRDSTRPAPSTNGTLALHASLRTQNPVRVMRGSGAKCKFAPTVGIRYDGLYYVVSTSHSRNSHGGLYEQFTLVRLDNQRDLTELRAIPTAQQQLHHASIKNYWRM